MYKKVNKDNCVYKVYCVRGMYGKVWQVRRLSKDGAMKYYAGKYEKYNIFETIEEAEAKLKELKKNN